MSRRRTLIANEIPNLQFETDVVDDEAEKRRRMSGNSNVQLHHLYSVIKPFFLLNYRALRFSNQQSTSTAKTSTISAESSRFVSTAFTVQ